MMQAKQPAPRVADKALRLGLEVVQAHDSHFVHDVHLPLTSLIGEGDELFLERGEGASRAW